MSKQQHQDLARLLHDLLYPDDYMKRPEEWPPVVWNLAKNLHAAGYEKQPLAYERSTP